MKKIITLLLLTFSIFASAADLSAVLSIYGTFEDITKQDCMAVASNNAMYCQSNNCKALVNKQPQLCN